MVSYAQLSDFCLLANRIIGRHYGRPDSCVFSTGVNCEVLQHFLIEAEPLRVTATMFANDNMRDHYGCVLGSDGNGTRMKAAGEGMWHGHLVCLTANRFILDSCLDQVNIENPWLEVTPLVVDLTATDWFKPDVCPDYHCTNNMTPFSSGTLIRYTKVHRQTGWRSAGDFRPRQRREIVETLIKAAAPTFVSPPRQEQS
jgi:hypothetical protein